MGRNYSTFRWAIEKSQTFTRWRYRENRVSKHELLATPSEYQIFLLEKESIYEKLDLVKWCVLRLTTTSMDEGYIQTSNTLLKPVLPGCRRIYSHGDLKAHKFEEVFWAPYPGCDQPSVVLEIYRRSSHCVLYRPKCKPGENY